MATFTREALCLAIDSRKPRAETVLHSDKAWIYVAHCFRSLLAAYRLQPSMGKRGNCYDNAHMEVLVPQSHNLATTFDPLRYARRHSSLN